MVDFPLHMLAPGLLTHPAHTTPTFDHLEGREIVWVIFNGHDGTGVQEFQHVATPLALMRGVLG